jgi:hypothetical protein
VASLISDCTSEMGCWPGQPRRAEAKKSPGGTRGSAGARIPGAGASEHRHARTTLQHRPYTNLTRPKRLPNKSTSVLAKPHLTSHLTSHTSPTTGHPPPPSHAAGGDARPALPAVAGQVFLLIDFRSDAGNPPRIAQQFVNVAAARLAADPEQSGRNSVKHLSANGLMRGDGQGNVGVGQGRGERRWSRRSVATAWRRMPAARRSPAKPR